MGEQGAGMAGLIEQLMAQFEQGGAAGIPGFPGGPSGVMPSRPVPDPSQILAKIRGAIAQAQPSPAMNRMVSSGPGVSVKDFLSRFVPAGSPAQAAPAQAAVAPGAAAPPLGPSLSPSGVPGLSLGGPDQMANLAPPGAGAATAPPIPMPKRFAQPVADERPAVGGDWQTQVKPETSPVQKFLLDLFKGAAAASSGNPNSKVGSFFGGAKRSFAASEGKEQLAKKEAAASEATAFERRLKTSEERRAEAKGKREERESGIQMNKIEAETKRLLDPRLLPTDRIKISGDAAVVYKNAMENGGMSSDEAMEEARKYVKEQEQYALTGKFPEPAAPKEGAIAENDKGDRLVFRNGKWEPVQ